MRSPGESERPPAGVSDWFGRWLVRHRELHPHKAWPELDGQRDPKAAAFLAGWMGQWEQAGITEAIALEASRRLITRDLGYPEKHFPAIHAAAVKLQDVERINAERRRRLEEKAQDELLAARREEARRCWEKMPEPRKAGIRTQVEEANPGLKRFRPMIEALCLDFVADRLNGPKARLEKASA